MWQSPIGKQAVVGTTHYKPLPKNMCHTHGWPQHMSWKVIMLKETFWRNEGNKRQSSVCVECHVWPIIQNAGNIHNCSTDIIMTIHRPTFDTAFDKYVSVKITTYFPACIICRFRVITHNSIQILAYANDMITTGDTKMSQNMPSS